MREPAWWHQSGFDQLEVPLIVVGPDRQIAYANPAARRLFGAPPGTLEGMGMERLVVPERRGELRNIEDVLKGGSARRVRSAVRREDGGRLDVTMSVEAFLGPAGALEGAVVRYEIITGSGRMSLAPGPRSRVPMAHASSRIPPEVGISDDSESRVSPFETDRTPTTTSGAFQTSKRAARELEARLARLETHLSWLEERLTRPSAEGPLDDPRERARALMVIAEARAELRQAMDDAKSAQGVPPIPAPPKLPTL